MRCESAREAMSLDADGRLEPARRPELEAHVAACPACSAFRDDLDRLRLVFRPAEAVEPSEGAVRRTVDAASACKSRRPAGAWISGAAAAALLAALGASLWSRPVPPVSTPAAPAADDLGYPAWALFHQLGRLDRDDPAREAALARLELAASGLARRPGPYGRLASRLEETLARETDPSVAVRAIRREIESSGVLAGLSVPESPRGRPVSQSTEDPYAAARLKIYAGDVRGAVAAFELLLASGDTAGFEDDILYWLGALRLWEGRRNEALGCWYALAAMDSAYADSQLIAFAQGTAQDLGGPGEDDEEEGPTPEEMWFAFEEIQGWKGVRIDAQALEKLRRTMPDVARYIESGAKPQDR